MNPDFALLAIAVAVIAVGVHRSNRRLLTFVYSVAAVGIVLAATYFLWKVFPASGSLVTIGAIVALLAGCGASLAHSRKNPRNASQDNPETGAASGSR